MPTICVDNKRHGDEQCMITICMGLKQSMHDGFYRDPYIPEKPRSAHM